MFAVSRFRARVSPNGECRLFDLFSTVESIGGYGLSCEKSLLLDGIGICHGKCHVSVMS